MSSWFGIQIGLFFIHYVIWGSTVSSQCQICQLNHHQLPAFDGKSVSDFPLSTQGGLGKLWMCTRMCSEYSRCRSYRYNSMTGACSTYAVGYSTPGNTFNTVSVETGSQLYMMCEETHVFGIACSSTSDCTFSSPSCKDGSCECLLGYSFDVNTGDCFKNCERYGDSFVKYIDHGVAGCNTGSTNTPTSEACMEACRDQTSFVCINAEYKLSSGTCYMCHLAWFDLSPGARNTADYGWVLYHRHCAL